MANPYKTADKKPKAAPGSKRPMAPEIKETPVVAEPVATPVAETPVVAPLEEKPVVETPKQKAAPKKEEAPSIIDDLFPDVVEEKPTGKPKTLYLDSEVVDALERLAKKKKMSASKVANILLRKALLGK